MCLSFDASGISAPARPLNHDHWATEVIKPNLTCWFCAIVQAPFGENQRDFLSTKSHAEQRCAYVFQNLPESVDEILYLGLAMILWADLGWKKQSETIIKWMVLGLQVLSQKRTDLPFLFIYKP